MTTSSPSAISPSVQRILADPRSQQMRRELTVERQGIDEKARTVELAFASAEPVDRFYGKEVLEISDRAIDFSRLRNGAALLLDHDWTRQIGVVLKAWVAGGKARATVKLSRSALGEEIWTDILDEVRSQISVGYIVNRMEPVTDQAGGDAGAADGETFRVTAWCPFEISVVAVAADYLGAGIGRSKNKDPDARAGRNSNPEKQISTMETTIENHAADIVAAAATLKARHPQRRDQIDAALAEHVANKRSLAEFQDHVLNKILATGGGTAPAQLRQGSEGNFTARDLKGYSLMRAIRAKTEARTLDGLEREASDEIARQLGRNPQGFFLPTETLAKRTLLSGSAPDGGYTVSGESLGAEMVSLLRNSSRVVELGARTISGLTGDVSIPRVISGATVYWVSEDGTIATTTAQFGQIVGKPRRLGGRSQFTKTFLAQTSLDAESFTREDLTAAMGVELDRVAICGSGGAEPLGILNLASGDLSTGVTFGAAPTWIKYLEFAAAVETANAISGNPAYVTTPSSKYKARGIPRFSNASPPIWDDEGKVGEFRARSTNQFPSSPTANQVVFGNFAEVLYLEWAGLDVVVDPYTSAANGIVIVTIQRLIDMVIRQGKAFSISADSGAQ